MIQLFSLAKRNAAPNNGGKNPKNPNKLDQDQKVQESNNDMISSELHKRQKTEADDLSQDNEKLKELFYQNKMEINDFYVKQESIQEQH